MNSRKYILILAFLLVGQFIKAQETTVIYSNNQVDRPMKTLVGYEKGFGGHLSLNIRGNEIYDETSLLIGGELVFTLAHALNIGVAGYGMPSRVDYRNPDPMFNNDLYLELGYGGLLIEPVFFDKEVVHFTLPVLIGAGWSGLTEKQFFSDFRNGYDIRVVDETAFFVFEPGLNMEVNLVRNVKLTLGGSYRLVNGSSLQNVSDQDLSGFTFGGGIRVGWF